jgi:hypothetical protein
MRKRTRCRVRFYCRGWRRAERCVPESRPQKHPAHGGLHRAGAASVQGLLALIDLALEPSIMTPEVRFSAYDAERARTIPTRITHCQSCIFKPYTWLQSFANRPL